MNTKTVLDHIEIEVTEGSLQKIAELFANLNWLPGPIQVNDLGNVTVRLQETKKSGSKAIVLVERDGVEISTSVVIAIRTAKTSEVVNEIKKWSDKHSHGVEIFSHGGYQRFAISGMGAYFKIVDLNPPKKS